MQTGFIAAIDLGTSNIKGVVGKINENNVISILTCEVISSDQSVRRGLVYNIEKTGGLVRKMVTLLENKLGKKIAKVYVSVSGQSVHTEDFTAREQLSSTEIITENVIQQLSQKADNYVPKDYKLYSVADVEYFVDDKPERNPVGVSCSQIEGAYKMVVGRPNIAINIQKSVKERAGVDIAGLIIGPVAAAQIALSEDEKDLGCAFIDFGAGTTSLSIFKGGKLRKMVVLPFGGQNITKDISALNFTESDAEQYKLKFGKLMSKETTKQNNITSPFSSKAKPDIDMEELNKVIEMRLDEITINIKEQIHNSGYESELGSGIIITGGASQLKNLDQYLTEKLKMPVRKASAKKMFINNNAELANDPSLTQVLGLLKFGKDNCEEVEVELPVEEEQVQKEEKKQPEKKQQKPNKTKSTKNSDSEGRIKNKFTDFFNTLFEDDSDE